MRVLLLLLPLLLIALGLGACKRQTVQFAAGIDHQAFTELLQAHVDDHGLVAYERWRQDSTASQALDDYLARFASAPTTPAVAADRQAGLLNLYNALTIREVLRLDPDKSFWSHSPFGKRQHQVGGILVSLDDIEHGAVRPEVGYRGHATLVCAAMSCPPLARHAFTDQDLSAQLDERMRVWLARDDLNQFDTSAGVVRVSKIFSWFSGDFNQGTDDLRTILRRHAPEAGADLLGTGASIGYLPYDKSLNEQPAP